MSPFDQAFLITVGIEGGYSNNAADPGGETMYGVTLQVAREWGYLGPMADLPLETAKTIFYDRFWKPLRLDEVAALSVKVACELFDTNVNMWGGAAGKFLQQALLACGVTTGEFKIDGVVGTETINSLSRFLARRGTDGELVMLRCLNSQQVTDYMRQVRQNPAKLQFFYGWVLKRGG